VPARSNEARRAGSSSLTSWTPLLASRPGNRVKVLPVSAIATRSNAAASVNAMRAFKRAAAAADRSTTSSGDGPAFCLEGFAPERFALC